MDIKKWFRKAHKDGPKHVTEVLEVIKTTMPPEFRNAHDHSFKNRSELLASELVGCFYCQQCFSHSEITEWHDDGQTGFCPHCGIDALIGSASGFKPSADFLKTMNKYWF